MSNQEGLNSISFDMPKNQSNVIKVVGVGGGGSNAINHMFQQGIKGVDFVICNTDSQALENSPIPNKIQLGVTLTEGLGAGANPQIGEEAALESYEEVKGMLGTNTKMIFITAGMGGGTGTGAAPIIAKMAKELEILTVGIVTIPFQFEGKMRNEQAHIGVEKLRKEVDSLVVINNNKLREVYGNLGFKAGFSKADEVLATASRGIAEVITHHYTQNIDLRDAKTVLSNSGTAIMGSANASGAERAHTAISKALDSPLLNDNKITGAKNVLLLIVSGKEEITIDEIGEINDFIQIEAGHGANIIMGVGDDESLDDAISVTVIATGFNAEQQNDIVNTETKKIIHSLESDRKIEQKLSTINTGNVVLPKTPKAPKKPEAVAPAVPKVDKPIATTPAPEKDEEVIRHNLVEDTVEEASVSETLLMPTTQHIKNIAVVDAEEVPAFQENVVENDFIIINTQEIINEIEVNDEETVPVEEAVDEQQIALTFDLPIQKEERKMEADESEEILISEESNPVPQADDDVIRYQLEDEEQSEQKATKTILEIEDLDVAFERKTIPVNLKEIPEETEDPMNLPLSEVLKARASERRARMKDFNYKFRSAAAHIDDIEKQPAYKRAGLDLEKPETDTKVSRTSVSKDSNDDIQLRRNNSFLHDNVD